MKIEKKMKTNFIPILIRNVADENNITITDDVCKLVDENIENEIVEKLFKAIGITKEEFIERNTMKDKIIDIVKEWEPNLILELIGAPYTVKYDEKPCKAVKDMDFELKVKAFKKELDKLLKDYDLEMYSGWISTGDDEDIIIKDLKSNKEIYYSSINDAEIP